MKKWRSLVSQWLKHIDTYGARREKATSLAHRKWCIQTDSITESAVLYNMNNRHSNYAYCSYCTTYQRINITVCYATICGGFIAHHKLFGYNV